MKKVERFLMVIMVIELIEFVAMAVHSWFEYFIEDEPHVTADDYRFNVSDDEELE